MAKKLETRQTAARQAAAPTLTKKQIARSRKESRQLRIIWTIVAAVGAVVLAVLLFALVRELVIVPNAAVAVVDGAKVPVKDYEDLLTYRRYSLYNAKSSLQYQLSLIDTSTEEGQFLSSYYGQQVQQYQSMIDYASESALGELIEDELIAQKAKEVGLSVTLEEARQQIRADVESSLASQSSSITTTEPISGPTPVPTAIPAATIDQTLQTYLTNMGLSASSFERLVQRSLLRNKVSDLLASQVLSTGLMIHVQLIVTDTQEVADAAMQRIQAGEDFSVVAKEVSGESQVQENGGDLGSLAVDQLTSSYGADLANAASTQEIGTLAVVQSNSKFYVVRVVERNENGTLPDDVISQRKSNALSEWLTAQTEALGDKIRRLLQPSQIPPDPFATPTSLTHPEQTQNGWNPFQPFLLLWSLVRLASDLDDVGQALDLGQDADQLADSRDLERGRDRRQVRLASQCRVDRPHVDPFFRDNGGDVAQQPFPIPGPDPDQDRVDTIFPRAPIHLDQPFGLAGVGAPQDVGAAPSMDRHPPSARDKADDRLRIVRLGLAALGQLDVQAADAPDPYPFRCFRLGCLLRLFEHLLMAQHLQDPAHHPL